AGGANAFAASAGVPGVAPFAGPAIAVPSPAVALAAAPVVAPPAAPAVPPPPAAAVAAPANNPAAQGVHDPELEAVRLQLERMQSPAATVGTLRRTMQVFDDMKASRRMNGRPNLMTSVGTLVLYSSPTFSRWKLQCRLLSNADAEQSLRDARRSINM
ncbi:unnamed protein product, partial [Ectocarpus fasciculatus]